MAPSAGNKAADVRVAPLLEDDVPASFAVLSASFGHDAPFVNAYYPGHDTPAGRARGTARLAAWRRASALSADSTFLKAVIPQDSDGDGGGERIIGFAVWTLMREPPPSEIGVAEPDPEAAWPDPHDREFITRLWRDYVVPRTQAVKASEGKGVYILEFLAVHPEYQRLGAGTALVKWGTKAADEKGVRAIVEGTAAGRRTYEKCGLCTEIETMRFDVGEEFSGRKMPTLAFMTREPQPRS